MDDTAVVLDAVGSERAMLFATDELGMAACLFAATYPERTAALILYGAHANWLWSEETPWEKTLEQWEDLSWFSTWGTRANAEQQVRDDAPSMAEDPDYIDWWSRYTLLSESPGHARAASSTYQRSDFRSILGSIHVPVLVIVRPAAPSESEASAYLAEHIPGAKLKELPGPDGSIWVGDQASVHNAIEHFLGEVSRERSEMERVLATVLFTDIVGSTVKAAELGDRVWRELLERHYEGVRALLARYRGVEVSTEGDGFLAAFDGPARAIRCAQAIVEEVRPLGVEVRAGLHTGEVEKIDGSIGGLAVHIGARVGTLAGASQVVVSQTVRDLVAGSGLVFGDAGEHELKGVPDRWHLFRVVE